MTRSERYIFALILLLALSLRTFVFIQTPVISTDSFTFLRNAKLFAEGHWEQALRHSYHPFYPALIAFFGAPFKSPETVGSIISILIGSFTMFPLFALTRRLFSVKIGLIACFILAIHPFHIRYSADVMSDVTYFFLYISAIYHIWMTVSTHSWRHAALSGVVTAMAYLTRPEGIELILLAGFLVFAFGAKELLKGGWKVPARGMVVLACFMAVSGWYFVKIKDFTGNWGLTMKESGALTESMNPDDAKQYSLAGGKAVMVNMVDDSRRIAYYVSKEDYIGVIAYTINEYMKTVFYPVFLLVIFGVLWRRDQRFPVSSDLFMAAFFLLHFFILERLLVTKYYLSVRHLTTIVMVVLPWAAIGMWSFVSWFSEKLGKLESKPPLTDGGERSIFIRPGVALTVTVFVLMALMVVKATKPKRFDELALRAAGTFAKKHHDENYAGQPFSFVGNEKSAFYAGAMNWFPMPTEKTSVEGIYVFCRELQSPPGRYLVFYESKIKASNPALLEEIRSPEASKRMELLGYWTEFLSKSSTDTLFLYKIKD